MTWTKASIYMVMWLALSVYYLAVVRAPGRLEPPAPERAPLLDVRAADVTALEIESKRGHASCVRTGDRWTLREPAGTPVAADLIAAILTAVTEPTAFEVISREEGRAADFGLADPTMSLTLRCADGSAATLAFGMRNPGGTAVYARRAGTPEIVLVGLSLEYYVGLVVNSIQPVRE